MINACKTSFDTTSVAKLTQAKQLTTVSELFGLGRRIVKSDLFKNELISKISQLIDKNGFDASNFVDGIVGQLDMFMSDIEVLRTLNEAILSSGTDLSSLRISDILNKKLFDQKYFNRFYIQNFGDRRGELNGKYQMLKGIVKNSIIDSLKISAYKLGLVRKSSSRDRSLVASKSSLLDNLSFDRAKFAVSLKHVDCEHLDELLHLINSINMANIHQTQVKKRKEIITRFQQNIIEFIRYLNRNISICSQEDIQKFNENLVKFVLIIKQIFENEKILTYVSFYDNDDVIFEKIWSIVSQKKAELNILTCPDYSGKVVDGQWQFDFNTLGVGQGVVTQKSIDFVQQMCQIIGEQIGVENVSVNHYLPSFEFENGFAGGQENLDWNECVTRLEQSAGMIANTYCDKGVGANVGVSNDIYSDKDFFAHKEEIYQEFVSLYEKEKIFKTFVDNCFKLRKDLYQNWYPIDQGESQEDYENRLIQRVLKQMAEYYLLGKFYTKDETSILLSSDSRAMFNIYGFFGFGVLYGQSRSHVDYLGA